MFLEYVGNSQTAPFQALFGAQKRRVRPHLLGFRSSAALPHRNMRLADPGAVRFRQFKLSPLALVPDGELSGSCPG